MKHIRQLTIGVVASLVLALVAAWFVVLRPGAAPAVSQAASRSGDPVLIDQFPLSLHFIPGCTFQATSLAISTPDGRPVARFAVAPAGFADAVSAEIPPCGQTTAIAHPPQPAADVAGLSFQLLSLIRYQGSNGTVYVETTRPSAGMLSRGLNLGSPDGTLTNGVTVQSLQNVNASPANEVQWLSNGLVISVAGDVSVDQLKQMAAGVTVR